MSVICFLFSSLFFAPDSIFIHTIPLFILHAFKWRTVTFTHTWPCLQDAVGQWFCLENYHSLSTLKHLQTSGVWL